MHALKAPSKSTLPPPDEFGAQIRITPFIGGFLSINDFLRTNDLMHLRRDLFAFSKTEA